MDVTVHQLVEAEQVLLVPEQEALHYECPLETEKVVKYINIIAHNLHVY